MPETDGGRQANTQGTTRKPLTWRIGTRSVIIHDAEAREYRVLASAASQHIELPVLSNLRSKTSRTARPVCFISGILGLAALVMPLSYGQVLGRNYGRSLVISQQGIVATSHTLASQAGAQILAHGGSAVDAAIAANAVLGVPNR